MSARKRTSRRSRSSDSRQTAIASAHREVRKARNDLRKILAEEQDTRRSMEEAVGRLQSILQMLERAEGDLDVALGRPRT